jgi:hypothetical protein
MTFSHLRPRIRPQLFNAAIHWGDTYSKLRTATSAGILL